MKTPAMYIHESGLELNKWIMGKFAEITVNWNTDPEFPIQAPKSIAAAGIYLSGLLVNEKITAETVAKSIGVHEQTVKTNYKKLLEYIKMV